MSLYWQTFFSLFLLRSPAWQSPWLAESQINSNMEIPELFFLTVLICHIFVARPSSPPPSRPATNGKWASSCRFCVSNAFYLGFLCPAFMTLMRLRAFLWKSI